MHKQSFLRANVYNFRASVNSHEFLNFFKFCPNNLSLQYTNFKNHVKTFNSFLFFQESGKVLLNRPVAGGGAGGGSSPPRNFQT